MRNALARIFNDQDAELGGKLSAIYATLIAFHDYPMLVGTALFGLRHAIDADHIAAIDNVTRL
jgi:high-affinity nickel permease